MADTPLTTLVQEGEIAIQQDPQGNWAIVQKAENGGQVMRVKTPTGILEQPLAQPIPTMPESSALSPTAGFAPNTPAAPTGMAKTMQYVAEGEVAIGVAEAGAGLLKAFFKK